MKFPYTITGNTIQVFANGQMLSLSSNQPSFETLKEHLRQTDHDFNTIVDLIDKSKMIERKTHGKVSIVGNSVYYNGMPVRSTLTEKLIAMLNDGFDPTPWMAFFNRLMTNPSERSRECLYNFLDHWKTPITEDGCFIAFKYVRADYKDAHTGTIDNSPGSTPRVEWHEVDDNPDVTCSRGLHVCASSYLGGYNWSTTVVVVKVAPEDVVAVPVDYQYAKMRTCGYEVLADASSPDEVREIEEQSFYDTGTNVDPDYADDYTPEDEFDELYDGYDDDYDVYYGHKIDLDDDDDSDAEDGETDLTFSDSNGHLWTGAYILRRVDEDGQRAFSRETGIPRSTLQEWLKKIRAVRGL